MTEKQKKPIYKRKWFIAIVVLLALGFLGSLMGEEETTAPDTESEPVESSQELSLEAYKADVADPLAKHAQDLDTIRANAQSTIGGLSSDGDLYKAYDGMKNAAGAMDALRERVDDTEVPDYLNKEQEEMFKEARSAISNAASYSRMAYNDLAKDIDKQDFSPSRVENQQEWTNMVEAEILNYASAIAILNADVGYAPEEET